MSQSKSLKRYRSPEKASSTRSLTPESSPVVAKVTTPITDEYQTYVFHKDKKKKLGLTPEGSKIPLQEHEGLAHHYVKSKRMTVTVKTVIRPGDGELKRYQVLLAMLKDLKVRFSIDFSYLKKHGAIEVRHKHMSIINLNECINHLCYYYRNTSNKQSFLESINHGIEKGTFYNPFRIKNFYDSDFTDYKDAPKCSYYMVPVTSGCFSAMSAARHLESSFNSDPTPDVNFRQSSVEIPSEAPSVKSSSSQDVISPAAISNQFFFMKAHVKRLKLGKTPSPKSIVSCSSAACQEGVIDISSTSASTMDVEGLDLSVTLNDENYDVGSPSKVKDVIAEVTMALNFSP